VWFKNRRAKFRQQQQQKQQPGDGSDDKEELDKKSDTDDTEKDHESKVRLPSWHRANFFCLFAWCTIIFNF